MTYDVPSLESHIAAIQAARTSAKRRTTFYLLGEWFAITWLFFTCFCLFAVYKNFAAFFAELSLSVLVGFGGIAATLALMPALLAFFCDNQRDRLQRDIAFSEMRIDIIVGVFTAVREFFGTALPEYSKHLTQFGLAEDLLDITTAMSARSERAHLATIQALQVLEKYDGVAGARHEVLKAKTLAELMTGLLEVLSKHEAVIAATEVDHDLAEVVVQFQEKILAAE